MSRARGIIPHHWGRRFVELPPNYTLSSRRVWTCSSCGLLARLGGANWYLVWTWIEYEADTWVGQIGYRTVRATIPAWTTARPPCAKRNQNHPVIHDLLGFP